VKWSGVDRKTREIVFARDGLRCRHCGIQATKLKGRHGPVYATSIFGVFLSVDHIVPRSKGGGHSEDNIQTLCTECNGRKGLKAA